MFNFVIGKAVRPLTFSMVAASSLLVLAGPSYGMDHDEFRHELARSARQMSEQRKETVEERTSHLRRIQKYNEKIRESIANASEKEIDTQIQQISWLSGIAIEQLRNHFMPLEPKPITYVSATHKAPFNMAQWRADAEKDESWSSDSSDD